MAGHLPHGITQADIDAHTDVGQGDAPQQWFECDACDGSGVHVFGVTVYEPGCGFSHASTDEEPCGKCNGGGGWIDDVEAE